MEDRREEVDEEGRRDMAHFARHRMANKGIVWMRMEIQRGDVRFRGQRRKGETKKFL
jgi:hypothetical protein